MLNDGDWQAVAAAVEEAYSVSELGGLFRAMFNRELNQDIRVDTVAVAVSDLLNYVSRRGEWKNLLEAVLEDRKTNATLVAVCKPILKSVCDELAAQAAAGAPAGSIRSLLLVRKIPFVDRDPIREAFKDMGNDRGWCALVVDGPAKVGKTYCEQYLSHERITRWSADRLAVLNLDREPTRTIELRALAGRLCMMIRQQDVVLREPQPGQGLESWAADLALLVASHADQSAQRVWILLDGFGHPSVRPEIHSFIAKLAEEASHRAKLRLVLLGYERLWDDQIELSVRREKLSYLTAADLQAFFDELNRQRPFRGIAALKQIEDAVDLLLGKYGALPAGDPAQVETLRQVLVGIVRELFK